MHTPHKPCHNLSGWILLDKPKFLGSTTAVNKIKRLFHVKKAGHAGTLDPLATGLLPIALGEATKTIPYLMQGKKKYCFTISWGSERSTDDLEGEITKTSSLRPSEAEILALLPKFLGEISQIPPAFSAIHINGKRAYSLARKGENVQLAPRPIYIYSLYLVHSSSQESAAFEVVCGSGTYIRSLARDLGRALGCLGHVTTLHRCAVAPFPETNFLHLEDLQKLAEEKPDFCREAFVLPPQAPLHQLPSYSLTPQQAQHIQRGQAILWMDTQPLGKSSSCARQQAFVTYQGKLLALGQIENGFFKPKRVLL